MRVEDVGPGRARVSMVVRADMVNGHDLCHGGLIASLADSAFALACNSHGPVTVAAGFSVDFVAPGRLGQTLHADAHEVSRRGRSGIYDVTVRADDPDEGEVIAQFRGRSRTIER
jgi:acyl-CoA thioesterase